MDETEATPVEIEFDLTLEQTKPYFLNGDHGLAPSCGGVGTLYYSVPNLQIDSTASWLRVGDKQETLKGGKLWYDNQYGTFGNPRSDVLRAMKIQQPSAPAGWDWMAIQFDDNTEIALSALHTEGNIGFYEQTGPNMPGVMTTKAHGSFIKESGKTVKLSNAQIQVVEWIKSTVSYGEYIKSHTWYPNRVEVTLDNTADVPENRRRFNLIPIVNNGQQGFFARGEQYSEGAVYIEATSGERIGRGFLESVGYADGRKQKLLLMEIPQTDKMLQLLEPMQPTEALKEQCYQFLLNPEEAKDLVEALGKCKGL